MDKIIHEINKQKIKSNLPQFKPGDTVKVYQKIVEGDKEKTQIFEGIVIKKKGSGISKTFTVRKISYGVGVEKIFPLYSPMLEKIEVVKYGKVRRAKLYYLRGLKGKKATKIKEETFKGKLPTDESKEENKKQTPQS